MRFNEFFIFPFEYVEKDSDIIIYGMGNVGKCYYNQVMKLKYCNVIGCVDKAADEYGITRYRLIKPEQIHEYVYDYLVIAIDSEITAVRAKKDLVENYFVAEKKIIMASSRKVALSLASTKLKHWMESKEVLEKELNRFWLERIGDVNYFAEIVQDIKKLKRECAKYGNRVYFKAIEQYFKEYLLSDNDAKNKIVILRMLYMAGCFDAQLMEILIAEAYKIDNCDAKMWLLYDISIIEGNEPQCRYENYYVDKRKLMTSTSRAYYQVLEKKKKEKSDKVAIISFTLGNANSSHNALIIPYANEMIKQGKEVMIFPMDMLF